jgi:hypothetical protein
MRGFMEAEDAAVYFGYFNNSSKVTLPFYYSGYVAIYTQVASYIASVTPFPVQPFIYGLAACIISVYFTYQLLVFVCETLKAPILSTILVVIFIALVIKTTGTFNLFTNLTYNIWIGWMGLYLRVLNGLRGRPAGLVTVILGILSAWSHSFCVVLIVPIIATFLLRPHRDMRILAELVAYLVAACVFPLLLIEPGFPKPIDGSRLSAKLVQMLLDIHSNMLVLIAIAALLGALTVPASIRGLVALVRRRNLAFDDFLLSVLAFVGFATVVIILVSGRLLITDKVWARYMYTPFLSMFLALMITTFQKTAFKTWLMGLEDRAQRLLSRPGSSVVGGIGLLAFLTLSQFAAWSTVRSAYANFLDGERFLYAAEHYRATCTDGAFIRAWDKWSLTLLCQRRDLPTSSDALHLTDDQVTVWGQNGRATTADHKEEEVPFLFQPEHVLRLLNP